jgi:hypothetical protein
MGIHDMINLHNGLHSSIGGGERERVCVVRMQHGHDQPNKEMVIVVMGV